MFNRYYGYIFQGCNFSWVIRYGDRCTWDTESNMYYVTYETQLEHHYFKNRSSVYSLFEFSLHFCVFDILNLSSKEIKTNAAAPSRPYFHVCHLGFVML